MSAQVALYVAVIVLFLVALAVITVAALVRRPRREWQVAVLGQTQEVRGTGLSDLRLKTVKARRVSLDEMWATNSVAQSAYVGAPRIPDRSAVAAALAPLDHKQVRQHILLPSHPHPHYEPLVDSDWEMEANQAQFVPAPPPTEEDLSNSQLWLQDVYAVLDEASVPPQIPAPPLPPANHYVLEDPFYDQDVKDGVVSLTNAGLQRPQFDDEAWVGFVYEPQDRPEDMTFQQAAAWAFTEMQGFGEKVNAWGSGLYASGRRYLEERKNAKQAAEATLVEEPSGEEPLAQNEDYVDE